MVFLVGVYRSEKGDRILLIITEVETDIQLETQFTGKECGFGDTLVADVYESFLWKDHETRGCSKRNICHSFGRVILSKVEVVS